MNQWLRSEKDTDTLRRAVDCSPDACVFRKGELIALVYCDTKEPFGWHLYLAVHKGKRLPKLEEVIEAREALLPGIEDFAVNAPQDLGIPVFHVSELARTVMEEFFSG